LVIVIEIANEYVQQTKRHRAAFENLLILFFKFKVKRKCVAIMTCQFNGCYQVQYIYMQIHMYS